MHTENTFTVETSQLREEILSILPFCYDIIFREPPNAGRKGDAILHKPYHSPLSWYRYRLSGVFGFVFFFWVRVSLLIPSCPQLFIAWWPQTKRSAYFCFSSAGIKGCHCHGWPSFSGVLARNRPPLFQHPPWQLDIKLSL